MDQISVAVTAQGGVAVALRPVTASRMYVGQSDARCPISFAWVHQDGYFEPGADGVAAVHRAGTGAAGFRYACTGTTSRGGWGAYELLDQDGGVLGSRRVSPDPYYFYDSAAASSGSTILVAYAFQDINDLRIEGLGVKGMPYDTSQSAEAPAPVDLMVGAPRVWSASTCGKSCFAVPYVPSSGTAHHLSVQFFTDGVDALGTYDVKCNAGGASFLASSTYASGHFGVAWGDADSIELYDCKVPVP
jgi:hypothetical protein